MNYKFQSILGEVREGTNLTDPESVACRLTEVTGVPWKVVHP